MPILVVSFEVENPALCERDHFLAGILDCVGEERQPSSVYGSLFRDCGCSMTSCLSWLNLPAVVDLYLVDKRILSLLYLSGYFITEIGKETKIETCAEKWGHCCGQPDHTVQRPRGTVDRRDVEGLESLG